MKSFTFSAMNIRRLSALCLLFFLSCTAVANDAPQAVATVLGKTITVRELDAIPRAALPEDATARDQVRGTRLQAMVWSAVFADYGKQRGIEPTQAEIESNIQNHARIEKQLRIEREQQREQLKEKLKQPDLAPAELAQLAQYLQVLDSLQAFDAKRDAESKDPNRIKIQQAAQRQVATHWVRQWKLNQALHREFGGRVVFQQAGWEPIDAYRKLLNQYEASQSLTFADEKWRTAAYRYFEHRFVYADESKARYYFEKPYWERTQQEMKAAGF